MKITVNCDGVESVMTLKQIKEKKLNVVGSFDNGYSHYWKQSIPFHKKHIKTLANNEKYVECTTKPIGSTIGKSIVSFS